VCDRRVGCIYARYQEIHPHQHDVVVAVHELSIAVSMIEAAQEELVRHGGTRAYALHLKLGPLSGVVKEALLFSYGLACEGTPFSGSELIIEDVPVRIYCAACEAEREPPSIQALCCPSCGTPAARVLQGSELELAALELFETELQT
jgi:hydrogenase nickel incorporation protein HypA/HybF